MDYFILIIGLIILVETTIILFKKVKPTLGGKSRRKIYVDTSALIDGRIVDIAKSGFIDGDLIILKSVLRELQLLADGKDSARRNLARVGLDNVAELERVVEVDCEVVDDGEGRKKVDEQLLKYARENRGYVLTLDYNLIKVAEAEKIKYLNINDLVLAVKTDFTKGDQFVVKITDKGQNKGQGVGHLSDGTMVVVEKGQSMLQQEVKVELTRVFENSAGRMLFAKIVRD